MVATQSRDFPTSRRLPGTGEPIGSADCHVTYCDAVPVWDVLKDVHSIWELARWSFPGIACYAILTLAACQIVSKATEGVFLHNIFPWSSHLSRSVCPVLLMLYVKWQSSTPSSRLKRLQLESAIPAIHQSSVNKPAQMRVEYGAATQLCSLSRSSTLQSDWDRESYVWLTCT